MIQIMPVRCFSYRRNVRLSIRLSDPLLYRDILSKTTQAR